MADTFTEVLHLRLRASGSVLPERLQHEWGSALIEELKLLDAAIGNVCTTSEVNAIRQLIRGGPEGVIL